MGAEKGRILQTWEAAGQAVEELVSWKSAQVGLSFVQEKPEIVRGEETPDLVPGSPVKLCRTRLRQGSRWEW